MLRSALFVFIGLLLVISLVTFSQVPFLFAEGTYDDLGTADSADGSADGCYLVEGKHK